MKKVLVFFSSPLLIVLLGASINTSSVQPFVILQKLNINNKNEENMKSIRISKGEKWKIFA